MAVYMEPPSTFFPYNNFVGYIGLKKTDCSKITQWAFRAESRLKPHFPNFSQTLGC